MIIPSITYSADIIHQSINSAFCNLSNQFDLLFHQPASQLLQLHNTAYSEWYSHNIYI